LDTKQEKQEETKKTKKHRTSEEKHGQESNKVSTTHKHDKEGNDTDDTWVYRNIIVRIISQELNGGKYFRRKAVVDRVVSPHVAEITVLEPKEGQGDDITGDVLQIDQVDLETVVPKETGVKVRLLRGKYRGKKAKVKQLDKRNYTAHLKVDDTTYLEDVDLADFAQIA
jgi:hypothetical protein